MTERDLRQYGAAYNFKGQRLATDGHSSPAEAKRAVIQMVIDAGWWTPPKKPVSWWYELWNCEHPVYQDWKRYCSGDEV